MHRLIPIILAFSFFSEPAMAQSSPPEARPFTEQQQGKSLSELGGGTPDVKVRQTVDKPLQRGFTSLESVDKQQKQPKPADAKTPDGRQPNIEIWLPPEFQSSERKWPVIVFSHGFGGCAKQSNFLTRYLADHGYIVVAPDHSDANCQRQLSGSLAARPGTMRAGKSGWPEKPFRNPKDWTDKTEADRRDDVLFALASLLDDRQYKNYVDLDHVGLMGHSLGGYTVLGLAGAWPSWKDKRFKAVLALSPFADPYTAHRTISRVNIPVMYQGGTRDSTITPQLKAGKGVYVQSAAPKYFIEFNGANHYAWTELERDHRAVIEETALKFFDKYLKEEDLDIKYEAGKRQVKTFWKQEGNK